VQWSKQAYQRCQLARYNLCFVTVNYVTDDHAAAVEKEIVDY